APRAAAVSAPSSSRSRSATRAPSRANRAAAAAPIPLAAPVTTAIRSVKRMGSERLFADGIREQADAVHLDLDDIAGAEPARRLLRHADAERRAGEDDGAGTERGAPAQERDDLGNGKNHVGRRRLLDDLAVEASAEGEGLRVGDGRAEGERGAE